MLIGTPGINVKYTRFCKINFIVITKKLIESLKRADKALQFYTNVKVVACTNSSSSYHRTFAQRANKGKYIIGTGL